MNEKLKKILVYIGIVLVVGVACLFLGIHIGSDSGSTDVVSELDSAGIELQAAIAGARLQGAAIFSLQANLRNREDQLVEREAIISSLIASEHTSGNIIEESRNLNTDNIKGMASYLGLTTEVQESPPNPGSGDGD